MAYPKIMLPGLSASGCGHISRFQTGLIITSLSIPTGFLLPLAGYLSDRFGRERVLVPALFLYGLGGLAAGIVGLAFPRPYLAVLAARAIQGIGASGTNPVAMALVGDLFPGRGRIRALGYLEAANSTGKLLSPLAGALLAEIAWYAPFFVYPLLTWPVAVGLACGRRRRARARPPARPLGELPRGRRLLLLAGLASAFLALATWFGLLVVFSHALAARGIGGLARGLLLTLPVLTLTVVTALAGRFLPRRDPGRTAAGSLGGLALAAGLPLVTGPVAAMPLVGAGLGVTLPALNTLMTGAAGRRGRGLVTAVYGSVRSLGAALGPPLFGLATEGGPGRGYFLAAAAAAAAAALMALAARDRGLAG